MNYTLSSLALSEILNFSSEQKFTEVLFILFIEFPSLVASQANFLYKISEVLKTLEYPNFLFLKWGLSKNKGFLKYILIYFVTSNLIYLFLWQVVPAAVFVLVAYILDQFLYVFIAFIIYFFMVFCSYWFLGFRKFPMIPSIILAFFGLIHFDIDCGNHIETKVDTYLRMRISLKSIKCLSSVIFICPFAFIIFYFGLIDRGEWHCAINS